MSVTILKPPEVGKECGENHGVILITCMEFSVSLNKGSGICDVRLHEKHFRYIVGTEISRELAFSDDESCFQDALAEIGVISKSDVEWEIEVSENAMVQVPRKDTAQDNFTGWITK